MSTRYRFLMLPLLAFLLAIGSSASAQNARVNRYVQTNFSGTVSTISGSTSSYGNGDDNLYSFTVPFAFQYDSNTIAAGSSVYSCTNGWFCLGAAPYQYSYADEVGSSTYNNCILWASYDMYVNTGMYQAVSGSSPNRVWTLEFNSVRMYSGNSNSLVIQVKIYETTNVIEMLYGTHSLAMGGGSFGIGLNGSTTGGFVYQRYGSASSTMPANDIRWTPPPPPPPPAQLSANPKSLNFGNVVGGSFSTQTFQIRSLGPGTLIFAGPLAISGAPDYSVVGPVPAIRALDSLQAGQNLTVTVSFSPITGGTRSATLQVGTNGRDSGIQTISLTGVGIAPAVQMSTTDLFKKVRLRLGDTATRYFPITSTGTGPLTFNSFTFSGLNPGEYRVIKTPQNPLPVGSTDSIGVTFAPTFEGRPDAVLNINSNALNFPNLSVTMFGTGILARMVVTPSPLDFGKVPTGQADTMMLTLTNPGTDTVRVLRDYLSTADADYTLIPLAKTDTAIPPGQSRQVSVIFTPIRTGIRQARFRMTTSIPLTFEAVRRDTSSFLVDITGNGSPFGKLAITGQLVDSAIVGQQVCVTDTLWNTGTADLTVTSLSLDGFDALDFSFSGITFPALIPAGGYKLVTVCFKPTAHGFRHTVGNIVATTSGTTLTLSAPVVGYGLNVCASSVPTASSALFASDKPIVNSTANGSATSTIVVTNCGDLPTVYNLALDAAAPADYSISGQATSATVQPGGSATFTIMFKPTKRGAISTTATITGGPNPLAFTLSGVGYNAEITASSTSLKVAKGKSGNFDVSVTNAGNIDWTPGTPTITGAYGADYAFVSGNTVTANGGSGTLTFKFTPSIIGVEAATATFSAQTPDMMVASINLGAEGVDPSGVAMRTEQNGFSLAQNFPNPVNAGTQINFATPQPAMVTIAVMDLTGHVVSTVANERFDTGNHSVSFDASKLASGTYFCTMTSGDIRLARQMVVSK